MNVRDWNERYHLEDRPAEDLDPAPSALLVDTVSGAPPRMALDLACGAGRNALWLAGRKWKVTAVDGAPAAIDILRRRSSGQALHLEAQVVDLESGEYQIEPVTWDLILMCYYLQRDLFEPAKLGVKPGGLLLAIVHIAEPGEEPTYKRMRPGELKSYFPDWNVLHYYEGAPHDPTHRRSVAEIVARRP